MSSREPDRPLQDPRSTSARDMACNRPGGPDRPNQDPTSKCARKMAAKDFSNAEWLAKSDPAPIIKEFCEIKKRVEALGLWKVDETFNQTWCETFSWSNKGVQTSTNRRLRWMHGTLRSSFRTFSRRWFWSAKIASSWVRHGPWCRLRCGGLFATKYVTVEHVMRWP